MTNTVHGVRRSNKDKRHPVEIALEEMPGWSDREISRHCGVSDRFVNKLRAEVTANIRSETDAFRMYRTKQGTIATMDTSSIGNDPIQSIDNVSNRPFPSPSGH